MNYNLDSAFKKIEISVGDEKNMDNSRLVNHPHPVNLEPAELQELFRWLAKKGKKVNI